MLFRGRASIVIAALTILLGGCAEGRYIYRPAQQATATVGNLPAARYAIPSERPSGEVLIASSGLSTLPESDGRAPALFVRMIVTNNSDETAWSLDTRQQFAIIGGQKQSPAFVNTAKPSESVLQIARGEKRLVDLYYRLPPKVEGDDQIPQFDFAWNVQTSTRAVADRTSFDRMSVEPAYDGYYAYHPGWGPYWWHDPYWGPYPYYYGGVYLGVGHYGYRGYGGYGGHFGGGRHGYIRATPGRR